MAEEVLTDALLNALSKKIDIALYPASDFAVDLGFDFAAASAAEQHSFQTLNPQGKYEHLLKKFVDTHGRGAKDLIDIFKDKQKKELVNFLEEANKDRSHFRKPEPGPANFRNQLFWRHFSLSMVVALFAIVAACTWNNIFPDPGKCASSPCRNGGICHELQGEYSCTCTTGYGGSNCQTEPETCASSPCRNGGTCHELQGAYSCTCRTGYGGSNCETEYIAETLSLETLQDTLRRHYEKNLFKIHTKPWDRYEDVDLEKYYTTVSLYKEDQNNNKNLQKISLDGSVNDIFRTKVDGSLPERIVLFGEAGRGKTTAVAKMAYDWANKKEDSPLKNVKLLFVFKMRTMNAKTGITEAIVPLLGKKYKKYKKQLEEYIDSHEKDIVMLFDGYDEFSGELNCRDNINYIIDILCEERCRQCRVLVTSRPVRKKDFYSRSFYYAKMVIEGYSHQHATDFIDKYFPSNKTKGTELKKYLEQDIVINEMIATPLFCTMVCYLWKDGYIHGNFTRTKLFDDIMELLRKHLNAKHERDRDIERDLLNSTLVSIGQVALKKLNNSKDPNPLLLSEDDFSEVHGDKVNISYSLGLLTKEIRTDSDIIIHIEFFHKLVQEYSAGRYLANGLDRKKIFSFVYPETHTLKEVFRFASGTSVRACRQILAHLIKGLHVEYNIFEHVILDFISEASTCAEDSEKILTHFFRDRKLRLGQVTASTVIGFEKLPGSIKTKITAIEIHDMNGSPDLFVRLWNSMNTSSLLSRLYLPIPADIRLNMKHLTSIRFFETYNVMSVSSLAHVLTFLPKVRELIIQNIELKLENTEAFCELWKNLHTSPDLNQISIPILSSRNITCNVEPLRSVQVLNTFYSIHLPSILINLPNLQKLLLENGVPGYQEMDIKSAYNLFVDFWRVLPSLGELRHLGIVMYIPCKIHALSLEPLRSVQIFQTKIESLMEVFPILLSQLPNISELDVSAINNYDRKIAEETFYDKVVSVIIDGLVKNVVQLKVLNMTFDPRREASNTVSRGTVENFIQMLRTSGMMLQLEIISHPYCVFNESDLIEIITSVRKFTSIRLLRIECCFHSEGELSRFAKHQTQEENQEMSKQSGPLMLTLFYRDREERCTDSRTEKMFVLPRWQ